MLPYLGRRLIQVIPTLVGVTLVVFLLVRVSGDPSQLLLPETATPEDHELFRRQHGLDQPIPLQYLRYLADLAHGDLGRSLVDQQLVLAVVLERLPATVELRLAALLIAVGVGIPVGVLSAVRRGSLIDRVAMLGALTGQSMATFWVGILLILAFAVKLRWLPVSGRDGLRHATHYDDQLPARKLYPAFSSHDGRLHILGTDQLGRDVVSRLLCWATACGTPLTRGSADPGRGVWGGSAGPKEAG